MKDKQIKQTSLDVMQWKKKVENRKRNNMRKIVTQSYTADAEGPGRRSSLNPPPDKMA